MIIKNESQRGKKRKYKKYFRKKLFQPRNMEKNESPKMTNLYEFLFKSYEHYTFFSQIIQFNNRRIRFKYPRTP